MEGHFIGNSDGWSAYPLWIPWNPITHLTRKTDLRARETRSWLMHHWCIHALITVFLLLAKISWILGFGRTLVNLGEPGTDTNPSSMRRQRTWTGFLSLSLSLSLSLHPHYQWLRIV